MDSQVDPTGYEQFHALFEPIAFHACLGRWHVGRLGNGDLAVVPRLTREIPHGCQHFDSGPVVLDEGCPTSGNRTSRSHQLGAHHTGLASRARPEIVGGDRDGVGVGSQSAEGLDGHGRQIATIGVVTDVPLVADVDGKPSATDGFGSCLMVELALSDLGHPRRSSQTSRYSPAVRLSDSTSIRSSLPWKRRENSPVLTEGLNRPAP